MLWHTRITNILAHAFGEASVDDVKRNIRLDGPLNNVLRELKNDLQPHGVDVFKKGIKLYQKWHYDRVVLDQDGSTATFDMPVSSRGIEYDFLIESTQPATQIHGLLRRAICRIVAVSHHPVFQSRAREPETWLAASTYLMHWANEYQNEWQTAVRGAAQSEQHGSNPQEGSEEMRQPSEESLESVSAGFRRASDHFKRALEGFHIHPEQAESHTANEGNLGLSDLLNDEILATLENSTVPDVRAPTLQTANLSIRTHQTSLQTDEDHDEDLLSLFLSDELLGEESLSLGETSQADIATEMSAKSVTEGLTPFAEMRFTDQELMSVWIDENAMLAVQIQQLEEDYEALENMRYKGDTTIWKAQNNAEGGEPQYGQEVQKQIAAIQGVVQQHEEHCLAIRSQLESKRRAYKNNEEALRVYQRSIAEGK